MTQKDNYSKVPKYSVKFGFLTKGLISTAIAMASVSGSALANGNQSNQCLPSSDEVFGRMDGTPKELGTFMSNVGIQIHIPADREIQFLRDSRSLRYIEDRTAGENRKSRCVILRNENGSRTASLRMTVREGNLFLVLKGSELVLVRRTMSQEGGATQDAELGTVSCQSSEPGLLNRGMIRHESVAAYSLSASRLFGSLSVDVKTIVGGIDRDLNSERYHGAPSSHSLRFHRMLATAICGQGGGLFDGARIVPLSEREDIQSSTSPARVINFGSQPTQQTRPQPRGSSGIGDI